MLVSKPASARSAVWLILVIPLLVVCRETVAQTDEQPHIVARADADGEGEGTLPSGDFRAKPMRVNVDLVMVPVTVKTITSCPTAFGWPLTWAFSAAVRLA